MPYSKDFRWIVVVFIGTLSCLALGDKSLAADQVSGGRVGNGGDWRTMQLNIAQLVAANWVNSVALNPDLALKNPIVLENESIKKLLSSKEITSRLAKDIVDSNHIYLDEDNPESLKYNDCAWTNDPLARSLDDIVFVLKICQPALESGLSKFANRLLIHESVHHLLRDNAIKKKIGIEFIGDNDSRYQQEEKFCDLVAEVVHQVFETVSTIGKTHWQQISYPLFKENDSIGKVFSPRGFHLTQWTGSTTSNSQSKMIIWGGCREDENAIYACGSDGYFNDGAIYSPSTDKWTKMSDVGAPSARALPGYDWSGSRLFVWGGCVDGDGCERKLGDGAIYDPSQDIWEPIHQKVNTPEPRVNHAFVFAMSSNFQENLLVWGGTPANENQSTIQGPINSGGVYNVLNRTWTPTRLDESTPSPRAYAISIWTGKTGNPATEDKVLIWGGCKYEVSDACVGGLNDGSFFDVSKNSWQKIPEMVLQPSARHNFSYVYLKDQAKLILFGGINSNGDILSDCWILNLKTLAWEIATPSGEGRMKHRAVWAGDKMLVFGGKYSPQIGGGYQFADSILVFYPEKNGGSGKWRKYQTEELIPLKGIENSAVWTGYSLLVWGGQIFNRGFTNFGSQFFPGLE
jgi:hypothetical protein